MNFLSEIAGLAFLGWGTHDELYRAMAVDLPVQVEWPPAAVLGNRGCAGGCCGEVPVQVFVGWVGDDLVCGQEGHCHCLVDWNCIEIAGRRY